MHTINRMMTNICSDHLEASKLFYTTLFEFTVDYDSDWFVHLISKGRELELGIIDRTNEIVPEISRNRSDGVYLTFVVDSVDKVFKTASSNEFEVIQEPHDTFYGQRRMLLQDPNGVVVDVSSPIAE